ncbi:MAG: hypothetical protein DRP47_10845 [Candidatus Zixiibacteriota bacterium]|nr:MAG: hypothetical protein DRP47_10845 [candidate division Zixibacteria bacterium]
MRADTSPAPVQEGIENRAAGGFTSPVLKNRTLNKHVLRILFQQAPYAGVTKYCTGGAGGTTKRVPPYGTFILSGVEG